MGMETWLRLPAPRPGWRCVHGACQHPVFAPVTVLLLPAHQKRQLSFCSFCILLLLICTCKQVFLVPYSFFVFCCSRVGPGASTLGKGPRFRLISSRVIYGDRCGALYQGHRCGAPHQGHLWNCLSPIATVAMNPPDLNQPAP